VPVKLTSTNRKPVHGKDTAMSHQRGVKKMLSKKKNCFLKNVSLIGTGHQKYPWTLRKKFKIEGSHLLMYFNIDKRINL